MKQNTGKNQGRVGKGRPPKEFQFKPGQSGNPKGKPKGAVSLTSAIKRRLQELTPDGKRQALDMLADNIIQDALDSSDNMRKLIWNYIDGLPKQPIEMEHKGKELSQIGEGIREIIKSFKHEETQSTTSKESLPDTEG